ncbi:MAG TPA: hypothetical protein VFZ65_13255 [Planctomycetota bacterium]|nr:hypothetical protein [Planctomycetota bacterium]
MRVPHLVLLLSLVAGPATSGLIAQQPPPARALVVTGLPAKVPLTVAASLHEQSLAVQVAVEPGWHLYGRDTGGGQPVRIDVASWSAFAAAGPLETPMDAQGLITGEARLTLPLRAMPTGAGLRATMRFMICDALECLPPITLQLALPEVAASGKPPTVLLVAIDESERTARIAAFLRERGLETDVTTYKKVQAAECDAHDVVLADSPTFGQCRGMAADVEKFPRTATPIVAVGFLGTQLVKAQTVAMTSGYI